MEKQARKALVGATVLAALAGVLQLGIMLWARHEMTQAETLVALHSVMFARTGQLYYDLNRYPFTVSPYMPIFHCASVVMEWLGAPPLAAGRLLAAASALGIILLSWALLGICTPHRYARWTGTLLVAINANLWAWGTVGQVDVPGVMFSLAGLYQYARYRRDGQVFSLVWAGFWVFMGIYCKQTMIASAAVITVTLAWRDPRRAFWFALAVGGIALGGALALNVSTGGRFFDNTIRANINPLSMNKIRSQLEYLALAGGSLIVIAGAGLRHAWREGDLLYVYLAAAAGVFALTAGKIGADLNYQLELFLALALCAGWTLDRLQFYPILFRGGQSNVTLLQLPLVLYAILNLGIGVKTLVSRIALEPVRRRELAELRPLLDNARGPVISMQLDPLLHALGRIDVEAELYAAPRYRTLSTAATDRLPAGSIPVGKGGLSDPEPIRRDLSEGRIPLVILLEDIFGPQSLTAAVEDLPTLPKVHLDAMRKRYRLARRVDGPLLDGDFLYEPIEGPARKAE
jgi:hypothetical protein